MYSVERDHTNQILSVNFSGEVGLKERLSAVNDACEIVNSSPVSGVLVDFTNSIDLLVQDEQVKLGEVLGRKKELHQIKTAIVHPYSHNPSMIAGAISYSQGYQTVDFHHRSEAIAWLKDHMK